MKRWVLVVGVLSAFGAPGALAWQPAPGHVQVPIWPGAAPGAGTATKPESDTMDKKSLIGGKTVLAIHDVSRPTMTVYAPKGKHSGAAVVVLPGGGYEILAIDLEGTEVCEWLASKGVTAVLLKYRVPGHPGPHRTSPMALADGQRTLGLLRHRAADLHLDPHKLGVLGFSAGGHLAAALSTQYERRSYRPVDAADKQSCRPDFAVVVYPGHLAVDQTDEPAARRKLSKFRLQEEGAEFGLNPDIHVTRQTSPTFLLQDQDDPVDRIENSLLYYAALKKAGVPVEMHLYAKGGHAFGIRPTKLPVTRWPNLLETWLGTIGMISG
ncbi:MAG: xylanase [Cyanobacteria bacterium RYN_339]|nr:xylanase [Cyanobacteria bacterium RYN_339]